MSGIYHTPGSSRVKQNRNFVRHHIRWHEIYRTVPPNQVRRVPGWRHRIRSEQKSPAPLHKVRSNWLLLLTIWRLYPAQGELIAKVLMAAI
jgi:hypothetical protein